VRERLSNGGEVPLPLRNGSESFVIQYLPNLLSLARLAIAPYLFRLLWREHYNAALAAILFAGITDGLDGYLARKLHVSSRTGEVLDPIADKVLLSCAFVALWLNGSVETWLAAIILGRDAIILAAAGVALMLAKMPRRFPPSLWGKLSTIVQISLVVTLAARLPEPVLSVVKWTTAALTVGSFFHYAWRYTRE
jgi:cardiolipin synthase